MLNDPSCVNYKDVATMTLEMVVTKVAIPKRFLLNTRGGGRQRKIGGITTVESLSICQ